MENIIQVSASIVIYNEDEEVLKNVIESFLSIKLEKELIIVDNSPRDNLKEYIKSFQNVRYIFSGNNLGFGAGHNLAFKNITQTSDIHLIINPDTYFRGEDIKNMITWMYENQDVSLSVPKVYFPDNTLQHTVRNIPTLISLIKRKLKINADEWVEDDLTDISEVPFAHGCFFIFQTKVFKKLDGFDEQFFMYMEDVDIFIRAKIFGKTVINPKYKIYHEHRKGSSKNFRLLFWHILSAFKFFNKYQ